LLSALPPEDFPELGVVGNDGVVGISLFMRGETTPRRAVCNRHHTLDQQLCRWLLLSLDRLPTNELRMTQELIAKMLGVRREGVTEAAGKLQAAGLIQYSRGKITARGCKRGSANAIQWSGGKPTACFPRKSSDRGSSGSAPEKSSPQCAPAHILPPTSGIGCARWHPSCWMPVAFNSGERYGHRNDTSGHPGAGAGGCAAHLAPQQRLGLRSQRRSRLDSRGGGDPVRAGKDLA
jgi:hypothetical protein